MAELVVEGAVVVGGDDHPKVVAGPGEDWLTLHPGFGGEMVLRVEREDAVRWTAELVHAVDEALADDQVVR